MKLIDTHCHLANARLRNDTAGVLDRARQAGLIACICASADLGESHQSQALARQYEEVYFTAGIHPHAAKEVDEGYLQAIERLAGDDKCVAIGEIGLDYHYNFSPPDVQKRIFAEQLDLARRLAKRVIVHTREALDETLAIVRESGIDAADVLFHSFTEGPGRAKPVLDMGSMISFSGIATFKNAIDLRRTARQVDDGCILIETDAPYLSPEPVRRIKTNEPAYVAHVAACLADARGTSADQFAQMTTANAMRFFGFSPNFADMG